MRLGVRKQLGLTFALVVIMVTLSMGFYAVNATRREVVQSAQEKLEGDVALGRMMLEQCYPGDWSIQNGQLYKGEHLINGDFSLIDQIGQATGDTVTIFQGDTRVATNVMKDGIRQVNTKVSAQVAEAVLKQGQTFAGLADVAGVKNQAVYEPIRNAQQAVIGIWYVGVPNTPYEQMSARIRNNLVIFGIIGYLVAMSAAGFYASRLVRKIRSTSEVMGKAEQGDLTVRAQLNTNDEWGDLSTSINQMLRNTEKLVKETGEAARRVLQASEQLNYGADNAAQTIEQMNLIVTEMAAATERQAQSAEETTRFIGEISSGVQQVAANSQSVSAASLQATRSAKQGGQSLDRARAQMGMIDKTVDESARKVENLGKKSKEIVEIVEVITGIAEQTNLLALNAAIEAARAGEQGRGFAVVADEVRQLAEQSAQAAKKIAGLVEMIQAETNQAVQAMTAGTHEVKNGLTVMAQVSEAFNEIIQAVDNASLQIQEVSSANKQMAGSSHEAVNIVADSSTISKEIAARAQQVAASAEEQMAISQEVASSAGNLRQLAVNLEKLVEQFKVS